MSASPSPRKPGRFYLGRLLASPGEFASFLRLSLEKRGPFRGKLVVCFIAFGRELPGGERAVIRLRKSRGHVASSIEKTDDDEALLFRELNAFQSVLQEKRPPSVCWTIVGQTSNSRMLYKEPNISSDVDHSDVRRGRRLSPSEEDLKCFFLSPYLHSFFLY